MKEYKVNVDGKELVYGALVERSNFTEKEWLAIYREATKQNMPSLYERYKNNSEVLSITGYLIVLEERYEALLEILPQSVFSKVGTHPKWVADAVTTNSLDKGITQDDVKMFIEESHTLEGLKKELISYFELEEGESKIQTKTIYGSSEEEVENRIHGFLDLPGVNDKNIEYYIEDDNSFAAVIYYYGVPEYS